MYSLAPYSSGEKLMNHRQLQAKPGRHPSFAPCQSVTVELNNYGVKPLWELVGFQVLDVFIRMRLEAFLQVSIFAGYKLLGLLRGEINESP